MLTRRYDPVRIEAGCDEAGRGALAGPLFAAAVILPGDFPGEGVNDSKQLSAKKRAGLRLLIEREAIAWAVARVDSGEIDRINVLNASILAMQRAVSMLPVRPGHLLVDGNRFSPVDGIDHHCIIKGDGIFLSIAAASILAKTHRDDYMSALHEEFPLYDWARNKGYPTRFHREQLRLHGPSPYHRKSFFLFDPRLEIPFPARVPGEE
ncbi:MAG: ribonuclease HII [Odoribacteraceae bacterium]|jgi:ribonuclease HII|nr:ribonuclease HII [Odoribacteraceae bacterium]